MVFQNYALYPHLTVKQNILFSPAEPKGKGQAFKDEMDRRVQNAAQLVQITELMDRRPPSFPAVSSSVLPLPAPL